MIDDFMKAKAWVLRRPGHEMHESTTPLCSRKCRGFMDCTGGEESESARPAERALITGTGGDICPRVAPRGQEPGPAKGRVAL